MGGGGGGDDADGLDDFEAIFRMMQAEDEPSASSSAPAPPEAKRQRTEAPGCEVAAGGDGSGRIAAALAGNSTEVVAVAKKDEAPPPDRVVLAFELLGLPMTASCAEVSRKGRHLARNSHPDKVAPDFPEQREIAAKQFQALQDARDTALAWLQGRLAGAADDEWPDSSSDAGSSAASELLGDLEARDELRACGLPDASAVDDEAYPESPTAFAPAVENDDNLFNDDREDGDHVTVGTSSLVTDEKTGGLVAGGGVLEQAAALTAQMGVAGAKGVRFCGECYVRKVPEGVEICAQCRREEERLWKSLNRRK